MRNKLRDLLKHSAVYSVGTISERAVLILFLPLITAYLSPAEFGLVALMTLTTNLFTQLTLPIANTLNRFYYSPEMADERPVLLWNLFFLLCLKTLILFGIFVSFSGWISSLMDQSDSNVHDLLLVFSIVVLLQPIQGFIKTFFRLEQKALYFVVVSFIQVLLYCIMLLLLLIVYDFGIYSIPIAIAVKTFWGILCFLPLFLRFMSYKFRLNLVKEPLKYGYSLILSGYSNYLLQSGDRAILKMFCPLTLIGVYEVGYRIGSTINFVIGIPVKQALQPIIFKQESQPEEQKSFLGKSATVYYGFSLLIGLAVSLFSRELVMLLSGQEAYHSAWVVVPFIVFSYIQQGLGNFLGLGMVMAKKAFFQSGIIVLAAFINIGLNFILIPAIDIIGAAIATVSAYTAWSYLKAYYSWKFYKQGFEYKRLHLISLLWIIFVLTGVFVPVPSLLISLVFKSLLIVLFPLVVFFSGFLDPVEKGFVVKLAKMIWHVGIGKKRPKLFKKVP